ncbi:hypothetical protein A9K97_gp089 [Tokyovirus A1]|uniref:hypothetical protein n=1 Tax=Tokyovirus A1 TaxID=1826170 RepID=UPI0007A97F2C|nr:hypothetical protein A9K97_gp089 [Tokyovirus A1]BAU80262.1 hypothetical protein [Tokyovirus A1]
MNTTQGILEKLTKKFDLSPKDIFIETYEAEEGIGEEVWCSIPKFGVEYCWIQDEDGYPYNLDGKNHPYKVLKRKILAMGKVKLP